jgi:hypothetical protein
MCQADERDLGEASSEPAVPLQSGAEPSSDLIEKICHADQLQVWGEEVISDMGDVIDDPHDYEHGLQIHVSAQHAAQNIAESAIRLAVEYSQDELASLSSENDALRRALVAMESYGLDLQVHLEGGFWAWRDKMSPDAVTAMDALRERFFTTIKEVRAALGKDQCTPSEERSDEALPAALSKPDKNYKEEDSDDGLIV